MPLRNRAKTGSCRWSGVLWFLTTTAEAPATRAIRHRSLSAFNTKSAWLLGSRSTSGSMVQTVNPVPWPYRLFFLYIEPISTILGAYYAHLEPLTYLMLTHQGSSPVSVHTIPKGTSIVLSQLANLYFLFALNEGLVLRATNDLTVWRTLLFGLLVADFGHLYSAKELGANTYYEFWNWNAIDWGNIGFVYAGAAMRVSFLLGIGIQRGLSKKNR